MKKVFLLMLLAVSLKLSAQDIDEIKKYAYLNQLPQAKEAVDKYLAVEKNAKKGEGWFYKGYVYNQLSKDAGKTLAESAALKADAFEAFKKYRTIDSKAELLTEQSNSPLFDIYVGFSTEVAVKSYEAKDLAGAFSGFKKALEVHDYIYSNNITGVNGYKFAAIDTIITLYAGISANEAKMADEGAVYYKKLADANIGDEQYIDVYQTLAEYYRTKKDKAAFYEILEKGRKLYPKNDEYWTALEIEEAVNGVGKPEVFKSYEDLMTKHPENYIVPYNYSVELYRYIYSDEMKTANTNDYKAKLVEIVKKAIANKATVEANFLAANFLYNNSVDIAEEARKIKSVKPDDVKKKKALEADATKAMNDAVPFAEAVASIFPTVQKPKATEKANYRQALTILKNIYEVKKDAAKMANYEKLLKEAE